MITVKKVISPKSVIAEGNVKAQRFFDRSTCHETDPLLLLDFYSELSVEPEGESFEQHSHRGVQLVTLLFEGEMDYTCGDNSVTVFPGDIRWITTGNGVSHVEKFRDSDGAFSGVQLWVNLPQELKGVAPEHSLVRAESIPSIETASARVRVVAGRFRKVEHNPEIATPGFDLLDVKVWPMSTFDEALPTEKRYFLFIYNGAVRLPGCDEVINAPAAVILNQDSILQVKACREGANLLVIGGIPYNEPIAWDGTTVLNSDEELRKEGN